MPTVVFHKGGQTYTEVVKENTNLVVRAGIKQFPYPHLRYECGMGKCAKCACRVLAGAEQLPPVNWKEKSSSASASSRATGWPASSGSTATSS